MAGEFRCMQCEKSFLKEWSDEEALAEMEDSFGHVPEEQRAIVCDDCYQLMRPEDHPELVEETKKELKRGGRI